MEPGLRERKKLRTREQIAAAGLRLFAERGFEATTVDDIAAAADVSRRTFFRYFARKEDVILEWKRQSARELKEVIEARPASEAPVAAVQGALATLAARYSVEPELTLGLVRLFERAPSLDPAADYASWEEVLAAELARRLEVDVAADPRPRLIAAVAFAVMMATVKYWAQPPVDGGRGDLVELLDAGFAALRREYGA